MSSTPTIEELPLGLILVDKSMTILFTNSYVETLLGFTSAELVGQNIDILVPDNFRPMHVTQTQQYVSDPKPRLLGHGRDLFARQKDGNVRPVEIGLIPYGSEGLVLAIVIDIIVRKSILPIMDGMTFIGNVVSDIENKLKNSEI